MKTTPLLVIFISLLFSYNAVFSQTPDWAKGATWYQIFPERFRNGSTANDPTKAEVADNPIYTKVMQHGGFPWQLHPWTSNWYQLQPWEVARNQKFYEVIWDRRYGGDLIGVIEKLDYLQDLGVEVLYFNPIFEGYSLHKYDATTYHHIDNNFGPDPKGDWQAIWNETEDPETWTLTFADSTFLELIRQAHARGMKIVIDGVFNHSGPDFWALRDIMEKQQKSRYKNWFEINSWDNPATSDTNEFDYKGWWGFKGHPELKETESGFVDDGVKRYFFDITRRWMDPNGDGDPSDGIDGWRLDVAEDVNTPFWEEWNQMVKSINPNAITLGEIWTEKPEWIEKKRFDALMNYPVAKLMFAWFINQKQRISVTEFDKELARIRQIYSAETNHIMYNLIDSHDTDRVVSMIKNPDRIYNQQENLRNNPKYDPRKPTEGELQIQKLLAIFQFTYVGAPALYYGNEAGMWGGKDPDCRKPMVWQDLQYEDETYTLLRPDLTQSDEVKFNHDMFAHYKKLIAIRKQTPALKLGDFETLLVDDSREMYAYARTHQNSEAIVVLNNSEQAHEVALSTDWWSGATANDVLNGGAYKVANSLITLKVSNKWGVILVKE
ncbi:MAG: glycoside hydrolase family 13 protein [bacterium]